MRVVNADEVINSIIELTMHDDLTELAKALDEVSFQYVQSLMYNNEIGHESIGDMLFNIRLVKEFLQTIKIEK